MRIASATLIGVLCFQVETAHAQQSQYPTLEDFNNILTACAAGASISLTGEMKGNFESVYKDKVVDAPKGVVVITSTDFLKLLPEKDRLEGFRLYQACFVGIINGTIAKSASEIWSDEVGGPGGAIFSPLTCQGDELLVGIFGKSGPAPFVFSMGPICATAQFNSTHRPISISQRDRDGDEIGSNQGAPFRLRCPANMVAIGYDFDSAVVNTNFGLHEYLVVPLKLRCSNVPITNIPSLSTVAQPGERQGNASHKPFQCPNGSIVYGIRGRAGQFIDAVSLGCRHL
jgi:hypothetical protein